MTETLQPPLLPTAPSRLVRPRDRKLAGVCEGLGRYTGTDPLLWRVSAVLLVLFGAVGVVLYVIAWVLLPEEGAGPSRGERLAASLSLSWPFPLLPLIAAVVVALFATERPRLLVPAAVLGGLGWLVFSRRSAGTPPPPPPAGLPTEPAVDWSAPSVGPAWPPPPLPVPVPTGRSRPGQHQRPRTPPSSPAVARASARSCSAPPRWSAACCSGSASSSAWAT